MKIACCSLCWIWTLPYSWKLGLTWPVCFCCLGWWPLVWEWPDNSVHLLSQRLARAEYHYDFHLLPVFAVSFLRSGTKLIFRRRSKQKEAGLSQSHDDLSNVTSSSATKKKAGSFSHRLIKRFSFKSKSKPKTSDNTTTGENWMKEKPAGRIQQKLSSILSSFHSTGTSVTCSPVPCILGWEKTLWYFTLFREQRWWTQS